jgi:cell division protein FtsW (lipid II flippase)
VAISYQLRRISPALTIALEIGVIALLVSLWRGARWWSRAFLVVAVLAVGMTTWLARQNHFEWMFHPLPDARYAPAAEATFVEPSDLVIAVERNGEAAAYPVRQLGYHHVVQDVVGRVPIVVTY